MKTAYTFKKEERLKSRKKIELIFKSGKSFSVFPFKVIYLLEEGMQAVQAGFAVSSRHFKKAVDRNRIKRLMRESYRLQKSQLVFGHSHKSLSIFFIYNGNVLPEYPDVFEKIGAGLQRLQKIINEARTLHS